MEGIKLQDIKLTPLLDTLRLEKIDDEVYFSEKYSGYISNSRLGLLNPRQEGTPEKFFAGIHVTGYVPALEMGSAVHELTLQPELFEMAEDLGKPTAKLGAVADYLYPIFTERDITYEDMLEASNKIEYYKDKFTKDRYDGVIKDCTPYWKARQQYELCLEQDKDLIFMDHKVRETVLACVDALHNDNKVMELLHPTGIMEDPESANEQAILLDVQAECPNGKKFIIRLKSKLDNYCINKETNTIILNDVKTIGKIVSEFDNNIAKYHYNREMAMYLYLLKLCAEKFYGLNNPKFEANYLVVSTIPNYYTKVRKVTYKEIVSGFKEFQTLVKYACYLIGYKDYSLGERTGKFQL